MKLLAGMMSIAILAVSSTAYTQPSSRFPSHTTIILEDGIRFEGFDLGGFTALLRMDVDLVHAERMVLSLEAENLQLIYIQNDLETSIDLADSQVNTLRAERERLRDRWEEENRLRLEAENSPKIGSWLGWGLAAAFGVATLVLGIVVGVSNK